MSLTLQYDGELARRQNLFAMSPDMVAQRTAIRRNLNLRPGERVLEIGSGNGELAAEMAIEVGTKGSVVGADISPAMVSFAVSAYPDRANLSFKEADAAQLPFRDEVFDAATAAQCLCLVSDVDKALAELWRVLKPGGRVTLLETDWATLVWNSSDQAIMKQVMDAYVSVYSDPHLPRRLGRSLTNAGFAATGHDVHVIVNHQPEHDNFSGQFIAFTRDFVRQSDRFSADDMVRWQKGIEDAASEGRYFFSLNRYLFNAIKPEN